MDLELKHVKHVEPLKGTGLEILSDLVADAPMVAAPQGAAQHTPAPAALSA